MKYSTYIILLLVLMGAGCQPDLLNTVPNDRITANIFWKQEKDAILTANAIYNYLDGMEIFSNASLSDIAHPDQNYMNEAYIVKGAYGALNEIIIDRWENAYKGIRAANYFLENVDKVETDDSNLIADLKGQVRFLRAYLYLRLVRLYGDVPLITKTLSIAESKQLSRTPAEQIWDFIEQEFTEAADELPAQTDEPGRITKGAALAFNARAMLYAGRYREAETAAKAVMDLNVYDLYPRYKDLFTYGAEHNSEVILDKEFIANIQANNVFALLAPYSQGASGNIVPVKKLVDAYEMTNGKPITDPTSGFDPQNPYAQRDPRLKYSVYVIGSDLPNGTTYDSRPNSGTSDAIGYKPGSTKTGFNIKKYINDQDLADRDNCGINLILMRYAEVLLTYAEAKIELGEIDASVYNAINQVRQRPDVNMPAIVAPKTQVEMRRIVRHERMVELAFEGQRFFDIRRWKIADKVMNGPTYGMTYTNSEGKLVTIKNVAIVSHFDPARDYLWPIPQKEIDLNPNLKQNPKW